VISAYGGEWQMRIFSDVTAGAEHVVLSKGDISTPDPVLVRMHAVNPIEDLLGVHPDRAHQLRDAMLAIAAEGRGVLVLLRDMAMKLEVGDHVSPHKLRQYGLGAQILNALGLTEMILLTNSPSPKVVGLDGYGLAITGTRPIPAAED
jgi:3,4-dihydroxy 2-butanone 4-phosphate synthase/GTP cyclohydrolase II